jgi:hypothetical protein
MDLQELGKHSLQVTIPFTLYLIRWLIVAIESIADLTQRPLYSFSISDLLQPGHLPDMSLSITLALATRWNAVLLMDEADVFLEARTHTEIHRNALVSGMYLSPLNA